MATLEELVVQISADTSQIKTEISNTGKQLAETTKKMSDDVAEFSKKGDKDLSFFEKAMAHMAGEVGGNFINKAFEKLHESVREVIDLFKDGVHEAAEVQSAMIGLSNSMALNGKYSAEASEELEKFTDEMEVLTGISQGALIQNLTKLSSLTGLNAESLKEVEKAAINASVALGKDFETVMTEASKGINGHVGGLSKLGISFKDTGDNAKNAELLIEKFNERFGGSTEKQLQSYAGSLKSAKAEFGNIFEELGQAVVNNEAVTKSFDVFKQVFTVMKDDIIANLPSIVGGLNGLLTVVAVLGAGVSQGAAIIIDSLKALKNIAELVVASIIGVVAKLYEFFSGKDVGAFDETKAQWEDLKKSFDGNWADNVTGAMLNIADTANNGSESFKNLGAAAVTANKDGASFAREHKEELDLLTEATKSWAEALAKASIDSAGANETAKEDFKQMLDEKIISQQEYFEELKNIENEKYESDLSRLDGAAIDDATRKSAALELERKHKLELSKIGDDAAKAEIIRNKQKADDFKSTMSFIASAATSTNKELAAIGKAAAIYQATIDGYAAIQKALAQGGFLGIGMAAVVGAITAGNIAKIAGVGLAGGIDSVPKSSRGGNAGDNFPAMLNPGERVVPATTNEDLKTFLAEQKSGSNVNLTINVLPNTGLNTEQIGDLVEQFNRYIQGGGMRLVTG